MTSHLAPASTHPAPLPVLCNRGWGRRLAVATLVGATLALTALLAAPPAVVDSPRPEVQQVAARYHLRSRVSNFYRRAVPSRSTR